MDNYYGIGNDGDHPSFSGSGSGQYTENYVGDSFDPGFNVCEGAKFANKNGLNTNWPLL